ncbi:MAG: serine/threonine protein kinase [Planctomycetes bacterium]|nr:serine/threonine protein kinase [Planctomycetota bacterium]
MSRLHEILGYEVLGTLGHGARSTIYAVKDSENHIFALKRVAKESPSDQRYLDQAVAEHKVANRFNHATLRKSFKLIQYRKFIRVSEVFVLMEMVDGVTMEQHQTRDTIELVLLCQQAAVGLMEMHRCGYVHADIKPNNIIVTDRKTVKIIDFGQSCPIGTVKERIQGTPDYIAPEQVLRRRVTAQTDVFNLGATMYWLLTNRHVPTLIPRGEIGLTRMADDSCPSPRELNPLVSPALSSLIMDCIQTSPADRPDTMARVHERLELALTQLKRNRDDGAASS